MTVLSTHPRLPSELTDMVIDHLHDDKQALARCSLVAKSWLNASHFHLFHSIEVRDTSRGCGFIGLLSFLESSCSMSVRNYLKELHLMAHRTPLEELSQPPYRRRHLYPSILAKILSRLPQLRVLTMRDVHFCQDPWRNHVRLPIKLDLLEMDDIGCATEGPDEVLYLLRLFSEVKVLNIGTTLWKVNTDIADIASKMLFYNNHMALNIKIDSLAVDPDPATLDIWLHVFRGLRAMETLQELSLTCMRWKDVEGLGGLIRQAGSHLLGLKLDPVFVVMQEGRSKLILLLLKLSYPRFLS
ncbi:hypothetical protein C8Q75DRAFT_619127 [Abortiporus biennis]|nr:hypothetical protein C8Q75DRAFT_619127 [Abortiporus biennis]